MRVDPSKPTLKAPVSKSLKLQYEKLLSNVAFKVNLRRYTEEADGRTEKARLEGRKEG